MATTFSTNVQIAALQEGFATTSATKLDASRSQAYSLIVTALARGGYAVATFTAAPTAYSTLTLLETRLVALDLLGGGATSPDSAMGGNNWTHWQKWIEKMLTLIEEGDLSILNDSTGSIVTAPSVSRVGIVSDQRDTGVTLGHPVDWPEVDALERWDGE